MNILSFINEVTKAENDHQKLAFDKAKKDLEYYNESMNLCWNILTAITRSNIQKPFNTQKASIFFLTQRLLHTIQSIWHLAIKGYYYDSRVLQRSFYENIGLCVHFSKNEEDSKRWFNGKEVKVPSIELFRKIEQLSPNDSSNLEMKKWERAYGLLCNYVHDNMKAVVQLIDTHKHEKTTASATFNIPVKFSKEFIRNLPTFPILFSICLINVFDEELDEKIKNEVNESHFNYYKKRELE